MKGLNALEIIFTLFVLIVVVLVVVRMFITRFTFAGIEAPIQDITETYNYEAAYSTCNSLCNKYESDCGNLQNAVKFCIQKANIDIDGDRIAGEKGHFNVVEGVPLCEDGIYCFHVKTDCSCGTMRLDAKSCLTILCDYYQDIRGYTPQVAGSLISNVINYGTCPPDINDWIGRIEDYEPVPVPAYESDWIDDPIEYMGPDHWWAKAGYRTPCGVETNTEISLECAQVTYATKIKCNWWDVPIPAGIVICTDEEPICGADNIEDYKTIESSDGSYTTIELDTGTYIVRLQPDEGKKIELSIEVEPV